jgi:hypothetical protein
MIDRMTYSQVRRLQQALDGHWSNARVRSRQLDALGFLPNELATHVLAQLDWYDIIQCSKVNRSPRYSRVHLSLLIHNYIHAHTGV